MVGEQTHRLSMADGQTVLVRDWPHPKARDPVLIVHGLGEHSGRYRRLAQWFHARGYAVRCYDQRGHGETTGPRGALRHEDDLLEDLAIVYNDYADQQPRLPLLLGHSMGGLVAARAVLDGRVTPAALVLSSPALRSLESVWMMRLAKLLARVVPNLPLRNGLPSEKLTHDMQAVAAYRNDPLRHRWVTPRLADFIFRAGASSIADALRLSVPTLLLVAGSDDVVDPSGSRDFAAGAVATRQLTTRFFDTLYHELFNEAEPARSQVLKQLGDWLQRRTSAPLPNPPLHAGEGAN
ncbi:alpha/beta hydrolase [Dyella tabacisoli]|uniref:Lysophospholipase n=1 Tax=Dyella tabacisoli TaxID=2282381 RepID=A0A369URY1_9GAMM|nr:lysophospholipase [Dyella tabacisoli]